MNEILQQRVYAVQTGKNITHAEMKSKQALRESLDRDVSEFLAQGFKVEELPRGFSNFPNGVIPQAAGRPICSEQDRIDREKAIEVKNEEIRASKARAKEQRQNKAKQKYDAQIKDQIRVLGGFLEKCTADEYKQIAETAGYRVRHFRDAAKGHTKLSEEKWDLVKKLIRNFKFGAKV